MAGDGTVTRTYAAADRASAEHSFQLDQQQAALRGWQATSSRWRSEGREHVLTVVYESSGPGSAPSPLPSTPSPVPASSPPSAPSRPPDAAAPLQDGEGRARAPLSDEAAPESAALSGGMRSVGLMAGLQGGPDAGPATATSVVDLPEAGEPLRRETGGTGREIAQRATGDAGALTAVGTAPTPVPWDAARAREHASRRQRYETLDLHCAGEPLRLVRSGYPEVPLLPINERRAWVQEHADHVRRLLMYEPRGHRDMYGAVLLPPYRQDADIAVLFMHNEGYSTMCGHGIIALTQGLIEEGLFPATTPWTHVQWETPAGLVRATADVEVGVDGGPVVRAVRFVNVPAYLHADRILLRPRGVRLFAAAAERKALSLQLAFGGAYYGIVDVAELGMRVVPEQIDALTRAGAAITEALRRDHTPEHPLDGSLSFVYGTIIVDSDPWSSPDGRARDANLRNVTVFADAEVDRSPCGSGTSALLAARYALGASEVGDVIVNAGITGESFAARIEGLTWLGRREAVVTSVQGHAYVTGYQTHLVDDRDPLGEGFLLR